MIRDGIKEQTILGGKDTEVYDISGTYFKFYSCSESDGVEIKINGGEWEKILESHGAMPKDGIDSVQFRNLSANATTIEWAVWPYEIFDNLVVFTSDDMQGLLAIAQGSLGVPTYGPVGCINGYVVLAAANANRVGYSVENPAGNSLPIYIGYDNTVTPTNYAYSVQPGSFAQGEKFRGKIYIACTGVQNVMVTEFVK